ncbi:1-deoxy-D-xylulose-5-phosphate reductoisomerase, partial [bacterium]
MKTLAILGSTGSIGESALKVVNEFPEKFRVKALAAGLRADRALEQAKLLGAEIVAVAREEDAKRLRGELPGVEVLHGEDGLLRVATAEGVQMVLSSIVGAAGLKP